MLKGLKERCNAALDEARTVGAESAEVKASYDGELKRAKILQLNQDMLNAANFDGRKAMLSKDIDQVKNAA